MSLSQLEKEIQRAKEQLEQLQQKKAEQEKVAAKVAQTLGSLEKAGVSVFDFLESLPTEEVGEWLRKSEQPHVEKFRARSPRSKSAPVASSKSQPSPKLAVGVYVNPHTGEQVEKIKRAPKMLTEWCEEFGINEVRGWLQS